MLEDILWDIRYFIEDHKKGCIIFGSVLLVLIILVVGIRSYNKKRKANLPQEPTQVQTQPQTTPTKEEPTYVNQSYQELVKNQDKYKARFGELPEGFLWDRSGNIISQGDKSMTVEDTVFAYLNGLQTLDMLTVQRYSNNSKVVSAYQAYFTSRDSRNTDISTNFNRNVYREALMSIQTSSIETSSSFADSTVVVTVNAKMLDLSDKDFWEQDELSIFKNLFVYSLENDQAKYETFLYNYILGYYRSGQAKLRDVQFTLSLKKYPSYDSGWLVYIDGDVYTACTYKEGNLISKYIIQQYREWGKDKMKGMYKDGTIDTIPTYLFGISGEDSNDISTSHYTDFSGQGGSLGSDTTVNSNENTTSTQGNSQIIDQSQQVGGSSPLDFSQDTSQSIENMGITSGNNLDSSQDITTGNTGLDITSQDSF